MRGLVVTLVICFLLSLNIRTVTARLRQPLAGPPKSPRAAHQHRRAQCLSSTARNPPPMRLKQPNMCDPDVRQYSGYVDLDDDKHVFFWYFGSRARLHPEFNKENDSVPLVFWFSGGPGCSSQIANWQENGPCMYVPSVRFPKGMPDHARKALPHRVERNTWAWNAVADIVFIDQPVGTGFSHGKMPNSTEAATDTAWRTMQAVYTFLQEETVRNNERAIDNMHIFGESYAGRYIPVFTEYLLHMNDQLEQSEDLRQRGFRHLPLRGIGIGNGLFDYALQAPSYYKMGCRSSYPPMFNARQCSTLKNTVNPQCISMLAQCYASNQEQSSEGMRQEGCVGIELERWRLTDACAAADSYCNGALNWTTPASTYDVRQGARIVPDDYVSLLRTNAFVEAVGASPTVMYQECSDSVFDLFASTTDEISRSAKSSLEYILSRQLPVLLYSGDADFICNWYGTVTVAKALEWQGKSRFANARINNWSWPAKNGTNVPAGQFLNADNLTFLRVYEAGHEVPFYQPEASLFMLMQFVTQRRLY